jgi:hypothetical protein
MAQNYYDKLSDMDLLRKAWHLARDDSRTDFMFDSFRFSDFGFRLDEYLQSISKSLQDESYHPRPLLTIDVPKSSLSVRPGSVLSIEDKIVLFAIACLIAPPLDKKLPPNVHSWRVKNDRQRLFHDHEILQFPFLKRRTIHRRIDIVESWYTAWPRFIKDVEVAYEREGYRYMVVSDIVAYFENIDLRLLRDLMLHHLPRQMKIVNFLVNLLEYWAWPTIHNSPVYRGIPQGNAVSSFLGNYYLLPLDQAFLKFSKSKDIKYLRYMDDVKVLANDLATAREALFLMNEKLRELRLNIQGSKTRILEGKEIREELFDDRLDKVNKIIEGIQKKSSLSPAERDKYVNDLKEILKKVKGKRAIIKDKELRLFRRLITGFTLLQHAGIVDLVLTQLERNPDERLLKSAVRYFRVQDRNLRTISSGLLKVLSFREILFPYQQAHIFMMLRYVRDIPQEAWQEARRVLRLKSSHWYVRQQAAQLLSIKPLSKRELVSIQKLHNTEKHLEVKKALCHALAQLPDEECVESTRKFLFSTEPSLQKIGRFYHGLLYDQKMGLKQIEDIFRLDREDILLDSLHQVEVLSKAKSKAVQHDLLKRLRKVKLRIKRRLLIQRIERIISRLEKGSNAATKG